MVEDSKENYSTGWVAIYRSLKHHWIFPKNMAFTKCEAWIFLLLSVKHKDNKILLGNELIEVKKGSMITSQLKLMNQFRWSKSKLINFLDL